MNFITPPALHPGDTIGIVAPASNVRPDLLADGCRELESLGFKTYYRPDITSSYRYFAGPHERRRAEFIEMLRAPDIHAIFCARGGYGSAYVLENLDADVIREGAKIFVGASDITLLLNAFQRAGVVAFHGPMVATSIGRGSDNYHRGVLLDLLQNSTTVRFPTGNTRVLRPGKAEGRLTGGCLSLLTAVVGTRYDIETNGSILVLEDIDAKPYQIDRMITQLRQARKFDEVRGVIFGEMLQCVQHPDQGYSLEDVILDLLSDFQFPILYGFPTGHTLGTNIVVPFGVRARLILDSSTIFELLEPAVRLNA